MKPFILLCTLVVCCLAFASNVFGKASGCVDIRPTMVWQKTTTKKVFLKGFHLEFENPGCETLQIESFSVYPENKTSILKSTSLVQCNSYGVSLMFVPVSEDDLKLSTTLAITSCATRLNRVLVSVPEIVEMLLASIHDPHRAMQNLESSTNVRLGGPFEDGLDAQALFDMASEIQRHKDVDASESFGQNHGSIFELGAIKKCGAGYKNRKRSRHGHILSKRSDSIQQKNSNELSFNSNGRHAVLKKIVANVGNVAAGIGLYWLGHKLYRMYEMRKTRREATAKNKEIPMSSVGDAAPLGEPLISQNYIAALRHRIVDPLQGTSTMNHGILIEGSLGARKTEMIRPLVDETRAFYKEVKKEDVYGGPDGNGMPLAKRFQAILDLAIVKQPSILVFDEIDQILNPNTDISLTHAIDNVLGMISERKPRERKTSGPGVLGSVLQNFMSGFSKDDRVVIIATTNHKELIPKAIVDGFDFSIDLREPNVLMTQHFLDQQLINYKENHRRKASDDPDIEIRKEFANFCLREGRFGVRQMLPLVRNIILSN